MTLLQVPASTVSPYTVHTHFTILSYTLPRYRKIRSYVFESGIVGVLAGFARQNTHILPTNCVTPKATELVCKGEKS